MKRLILIVVLALSINVYAEDDKTVTLVVSGQGKTQDEAKQNALRSAIEQAFGTFISSKTEILNDSLIKDEIITVSNGNIQKFEIISELKIPNGDYTTSLKATVSVSKLTSFVESKGVVAEFKGGLFASNILIQELYEKNETEAVIKIVEVLKEISLKSFDYSINVADPISNNGIWNIPITVDVIANSNFLNIQTLLEQTIKSLSLPTDERENYIKLNKPIFTITLATLNSNGIYYLRNSNSIKTIVAFIYSLNNSIVSFYIFNGVKKNHLSNVSNLEMVDDDFRIILKNRNDGSNYNGICAASVFHNFCGSWHDSKKPNFDYNSVMMDNPKFFINYGASNDQSHNLFSRKEFKSFYPLKKIMLNNEKVGIVISLASIKSDSSIVKFRFNDLSTIDEIKKITKYEIVKQKWTYDN
jgi:hypothetical protein